MAKQNRIKVDKEIDKKNKNNIKPHLKKEPIYYLLSDKGSRPLAKQNYKNSLVLIGNSIIFHLSCNKFFSLLFIVLNLSKFKQIYYLVSSSIKRHKQSNSF